MPKSTKHVVNHAVVVVRHNEKTKLNETITVPPGKAFEFTEQELEDIIRHQGEESVRKPINEDEDAFVEGEPIKLTAAQRKAADKAAKAAQSNSTPPRSKTGDESDSAGSDNTSADGESGEDDDGI